MSATESFAELTDRLKREREEERARPVSPAPSLAHVHETASWRWDPEVTFWVGTCGGCGATYLAAPWIAEKLERLAEEEADRLRPLLTPLGTV